MTEEYNLYEENSNEKRLIATFYTECDLLAYIIALNLPEKHNYFIMKREISEQKISVESFKGICNWKLNKCK